MSYLNGGRWTLTAEFTEVESGKRSDRRQLPPASGSRPSSSSPSSIGCRAIWPFIAALMESGVESVAVDNPHMNKLTIHILAAVAEHEREMLSERTKAALAAAKRRGQRLGSKRGTATGKANARRTCVLLAAGCGRMCRWGQFYTLSSQAPARETRQALGALSQPALGTAYQRGPPTHSVIAG